MSSKSNDQGRAYEYICLIQLGEEIGKIRPVLIEHNSAYYAAESAWNSIDYYLQELLTLSARAAIDSIFMLEPNICQIDEDSVNLQIQIDEKGEEGDVRDILISREAIRWQIGLSLKHNHFAVKHSRLSGKLDFGDKWYGVPCSQAYWDEVSPIFDRLNDLKRQGVEWNQLVDKDTSVYVPLLSAFMDEVIRSDHAYTGVPRKLVEYLLGKYDFYKMISVDNRRLTLLQSYNLHGTLNQSSSERNPEIEVPIVDLPDRIVAMDFKPGSSNTVELYMNNGWSFSFRIHNASTLVEPSLKFDVQIIGMPISIVTINCYWDD